MQVPTPLDEHIIPKSAAKIDRHHKCREYNNVVANRSTVGHKPNKHEIGRVRWPGKWSKNAWDDAIRSLILRLLDMNVIELWGVEAGVPTET
jgi:hypothetical protein